MAWTIALRLRHLMLKELTSMIIEEDMQLKMHLNANKAYVVYVKHKGKAKNLGKSFELKKKKVKCFLCKKKGCMAKESQIKQVDVKNGTIETNMYANDTNFTKFKIFITMVESSA